MKIRDNVKPSLPPIPGGTYLGICVYSIAIGEQLCEYEGKSKSYNKQVMLGFEICGKTTKTDIVSIDMLCGVALLEDKLAAVVDDTRS